MLWRCRCSLLHSTLGNEILKALAFMSIRQLSVPKVCATGSTHKFTCEDLALEKNRITLAPQIVQSTLLNCPSDLINLSFFLWCAKQKNYFHDSKAFDCMISVVTRLTNQCKTVKGILKKLESVGCVIRAQTFLLLLRIYWRGGTYGMVFETFEEMERWGFTPNRLARNIIMDVLFKIGHVDVAIKVLNESPSPNFLTFNIALCNLCKSNDLSHLKGVIRRMLREGYYPNIETLEMTLNRFCKIGRLSEAYQLLGLMITMGMSMSVNVWSILIDGLCRLGQLGVASDLMRRMLETGCAPNVITYTALIKGLLKSNMVDDAFGLLNTMESQGCAIDLVLCNVLIDCLSKIGRCDDALDIFTSLSKRNLEPDLYTFSSLISNVCLSRRFYLLHELASGLAIEGDLVVCNSLLNYYCKAGYPSHAVQLYDYMLDGGFTPDKYSFVGLLSGLCGARKIEEAVNVYQGLVMTCPGLDAHVHTIIIDRLIRANKCHRAFRLFRRAMEEKYPLDVVSYIVAIRGLLQGGRVEEASALYSQIKDLGFSLNARAYNALISGFCKKKDVKMVEQLMKEIIEARIELDHNTLIRAIKLLFELQPNSLALSQSGMWNLDLMPDEATYRLFCNGLSCSGKIGAKSDSFRKAYLDDNPLADASSSAGLYDVTASVG